jgi:hypothetical protein
MEIKCKFLSLTHPLPIFHLSSGLQTSSNILPNPLFEHPAQHTPPIVDKHSPPEFSHHSNPNHVKQQNQKTSHHFSVNRRVLNDVDDQQQHHNLVVSYENSIDKSISKDYSKCH